MLENTIGDGLLYILYCYNTFKISVGSLLIGKSLDKKEELPTSPKT